KSNVFYAHIGGVPNQLLHFDPTDLSKSQLTSADWIRILGKGAAGYTVGGATALTHDYTGIDPHMIESYADRTMDPAYANSDKTGASALQRAAGPPGGTAPGGGRGGVTHRPRPTSMRDAEGCRRGHGRPAARQYACIFPIAARDCTAPANANSCDCPADATGL